MVARHPEEPQLRMVWPAASRRQDRKSTRLNSSHSSISYAVFCLKKKNEFDLRLVWSSKTGFHLRVSGALDIVIPLHLSFAGFTVSALHLRVASVEGQVRLVVGIAASFFF